MNIVLLLYAMIAGLAGINAGPSAVARMAAVAQDGSLAAEARSGGSSQVAAAARAMLQRAMRESHWAAAPSIDARRVALALPAIMLRAQSRATPERRLE